MFEKSRLPEDVIKFKHLLKMLVWTKKQTGRPSGEIIQAILTKSNKSLTFMVHQNSSETDSLII